MHFEWSNEENWAISSAAQKSVLLGVWKKIPAAETRLAPKLFSTRIAACDLIDGDTNLIATQVQIEITNLILLSFKFYHKHWTREFCIKHFGQSSAFCGLQINIILLRLNFPGDF